ncbi:MAG TPA: HAD family hydrolase [Candidatus Kapabacteria bacterium]|nr:HAD family hydrolase [Candidatus Kapabacteria bacterium]
MIKLITIDFWNTLYDSSNGMNRNALRQHTMFEEIAKHGYNVSNEEYEQALNASWEFFNDLWVNQQRTPLTEETIEFFWQYLNLPYDDYSIGRIAKVFKDSILDYPPKLMSGVKEFLEQYHNDMKFGLISDTGFTPGSILVELMEIDGIAQYFSAFSFSDETGVSKPNPIAFNKILNTLNINPDEALHIGDIEKTDVIGAKEIGMRTIRFDGDKSSNMMKDNPKDTIANFRCNTWYDINFIISRIK